MLKKNEEINVLEKRLIEKDKYIQEIVEKHIIL